MIDPSIALQGNKQFGPDWASIQNQQLVNQKVLESNANLPAIQAEAAMKVRANDAQSWFQNNTDKFTDPNGAVDIPKAATALAHAGYVDAAQGIMAHHLQQNILGTTDATNRFNLVKSQQENIANVLNGTPVGPAQNALAEKFRAGYNLAGNVPFSTNKAGDSVISKFYAYDKSGNPIIDPNGNPAIDISKVQAINNASMSPETQAAITRYKLADHTTPASLDPTSDVSKSSQETAIQLGLAKPGDAPQSDYYWNTRPDFSKAMVNNVASSDLLTSQKLAAQKHLVDKQTADATINALQSTPLMKSSSWKPGTALVNVFNAFSNDPSVAAFKSMVEKAKAIDPSIDPSIQDGPSIMAKLQQISKYNADLSDTYTNRANSTFNNLAAPSLSATNPTPAVVSAPVTPNNTRTSPTKTISTKVQSSGITSPSTNPTPSTTKTISSASLEKMAKKYNISAETARAQAEAAGYKVTP